MAKKNNNIGGLWKNEKGYISGSISKEGIAEALESDEDVIRVIIFPNDYKTEDKHPDFNILLSNTKKKEDKPKKKYERNSNSIFGS